MNQEHREEVEADIGDHKRDLELDGVELPMTITPEAQRDTLQRKVEELEQKLRVMTSRNESFSRMLPLCSDHRDKQYGKDCLACTIEVLEKRLIKHAELAANNARLREVLEDIAQTLDDLNGAGNWSSTLMMINEALSTSPSEALKPWVEFNVWLINNAHEIVTEGNRAYVQDQARQLLKQFGQ